MNTRKGFALFFLLSFFTSLVVAGHGIAPIGFFLLYFLIGLVTNPIELIGNIPLLSVVAVVLSFVSLLLVLLGVLKRGNWQYWLLFVGAVTGIAAWIGFLLISEERLTTVAFSAHFIVASSILLGHLLKSAPGR